jgi:hypothetical protein
MLWGPSIGHTPWESGARFVGEHLWAAKASSIAILGLELGFPLVLVFKRVRVWFVLLAAGLHVGTWLLLGLDYWAWALTVPLIFIDWPAVVRSRPRSRRVHDDFGGRFATSGVSGGG